MNCRGIIPSCVSVLCLFSLVFGTTSLSAETVVKKVLKFQPTSENLLKSDLFRPYEKGFEMQDGCFVCDNGDDKEVHRGVRQHVVLNQTVPMPIVAEAWSRAENVEGAPDSNYAVYLDLVYDDGTPLWGQATPFAIGTHDWERRQVVVFPEKPVKSLSFYTLFRNKSGKVRFRDMKLSTLEAEKNAVLFDGVPIEKSGKVEAGLTTLQLRDVAAGSDFVLLEDSTFGIRTEKKVETGNEFGKGTTTTLTLRIEDEKDRCLTLVFAVDVSDFGDIRFCEMRRNIPQSEYANREHFGPTAHYQLNDVGSNGRLSKFPLAAVTGFHGEKEIGQAVAIDLAFPGFFRTGFNEATGELFVAVDFALTRESPSATFRFVQFPFESKYGFREALQEYYDRFPDFFRCDIQNQGVWMPFARISEVKDFEDFGFRFKEGDNETAWDDEHDMLTFRYTEPMTWWMTLPKEMPRTYQAGLEQARKLAEQGNAWAKALFVCGMKDIDGRFSHRILDTPWCNGVVWSFCDLPGLDGGGYALKWSPEIAEKRYGEEARTKAVLDGEYVDSSEGYVTAILNFDRDHFSAANTPLVFSRDENKPAIFRGLVAYEYVRSMSEDVRGRGKLMMANSTPHSLCWLAPYLDVMGTETNWNPNGRWAPTSDGELMFRRAAIGSKPYCFLMNTDFTQWTFDMSEKFMKRALFYGMFPGFFSADASTKQYFTQPELYERDRPLFKKYVPICKKVAQAGWQPIPLAESSDEKIYVERFGDVPENRYFTVLNDSAEKRTATIRFAPELRLTRLGNLLDEKTFVVETDSISVELLPDEAMVLSPQP